ncbi:transposase, partial [Roseibium sediminis]|uniref:transposase n=1 Tax=Roseibium sediminis TaxID=1775174 RepID=UPI003CC7E56C
MLMTKQTRRRFTPEYKEQAVARLSEDGVTYASLACELGVTSGQLKSWHRDEVPGHLQGGKFLGE